MLTGWKAGPETSWPYEVSNVALRQGLQHLQNAIVNFWAKRATYPSFKSGRRMTLVTNAWYWELFLVGCLNCQGLCRAQGRHADRRQIVTDQSQPG